MEKGPVMGKPVKKQPKKIAKIEKGTRNMPLFTSIQLVSKAGTHVKKKEQNWKKNNKFRDAYLSTKVYNVDVTLQTFDLKENQWCMKFFSYFFLVQ